MKKIFGLLAVIIAVSVFNIGAMERGENVAPVALTSEELGRRLQQQRQERQAAARRRREQERQANQDHGARQNLNLQFEELMDVEQ